MPATKSIFDIYKNEPGVQEAFRALRTNIQFSSVDKPVKLIAVTSVAPGEGKTSVALMLGLSMAEAGKKTLLVEVDCRRPMLGSRLKLRPKNNWAQCLYSDVPLRDVVVPTILRDLYFMDIEPQMMHLPEILNSHKFGLLLEKLRAEFDVVIFDNPPPGIFIEAAVLSHQTDGTLLVIKTGTNDIKEELDAIAQLEKANARILGAVLNGMRYASSKYGYYYYYKNDKDDKKRFRGRRRKTRKPTAKG